MSTGNQQDPDAFGGDPIIAQLAEGPPTGRNLGPIFGGILIVFMIAIVLGPLLFMGFSEEVVKWRIASVMEQRLDGDLDGAIEQLDRLIEAYPGDAKLYRQRAEWHQDRGDFQASLSDYDSAIELEPENASARLARSGVYQRLGRHEDAIKDLNELSESGRADELMMLNALAYARAVANSELDPALEDANRAIELIDALPGRPEVLQFKAAVLDTRGFIHYLRDDLEAARQDLKTAIDLTKRRLDEIRQQAESNRLGIVDIREQNQLREEVEESMAVMLYHRGLVYDKLGDSARAEADFDQVRELGHEPNNDLF